MSEIKFIIKLPIFMYTKGEKRLRTAVLILSNVTHVMSVLHIVISYMFETVCVPVITDMYTDDSILVRIDLYAVCFRPLRCSVHFMFSV